MYKIAQSALISALFFFVNTASFAQVLNPVTWDFSTNQLAENEYELVFSAKIEEGWKVYSQWTDDNGPVPTYIEYEDLSGSELVGESIEEGHLKEGPDALFGGVVVKSFMSDELYIIKQKVKTTNSTGPIKGFIEFMACDSEKCLPPTPIDFAFNVGAGTAVSVSNTPAGAAISEGNKLDQVRPSISASLDKPLGSCGEVVEEKTGLLAIFLGGFIGGLVAILLPCIFPMIPITVSFFTKDNNRKGWVNGLIYGVSIIVIFVAIGLLVTALLGPEALNRLSTNWIANSFFFLIFIFFAFSFFGYYEITLPSSWSTKTDSMSEKGGLIGIFFMAATLAIVSFSCTGPIIGTALVQVASQGDYWGPFLIMLGFSSALAIPFGLFAAFPSWLNSLPRSGSWMTSVKVVLGFLELALALKFLSVADMTNHWGFLRYELFLALWILVFAGMTLYLFGFIKFPHDSPIKKLSLPRKAFAFGGLALTLFLFTGFMKKEETGTYNSLSLLSGLAPPATYNFFNPAPAVDPSIKAEFSSFTKCANNLDCFKDYYDALAYAKKVNKPIFLDFTGYGCVNCRKMEEHVWVKEDIRAKLANDYVIASLYVDDDAALDEQYVSATRGSRIRNVGNKWADFQIVNFKQNSQPLYVLLSPDEEVIAVPRGYNEDAEEYGDFLECGINTFRSKK